VMLSVCNICNQSRGWYNQGRPIHPAPAELVK
jgi:hypothetical protein